MSESDEDSHIWGVDVIKNHNKAASISQESTQVVRKFINSAIYIEKPLSASVSSGNTSISQKFSNEDLLELQNLKTKRCTCSSDRKSCPCHLNDSLIATLEKELSPDLKPAVIHRKSASSAAAKSDINRANTKVSQTGGGDVKRAIQTRTAKKQTVPSAKKKSEISIKDKASKKDLTKDEREAIVVKERENFKNWLEHKKKVESDLKKKRQKEEEEKQLKDLGKEKRQLENQLKFQLWLKKKEEAHLEKRIKEQLELISDLEQKERQIKDNERAFNEWLKTSKNRQKPIPLNKGLETLCSSTSIAYVNPNPWHPIDKEE